MFDINFDKFLNIHSPGYVIRTYKEGKIDEYVIGNKRVVPYKEKVNSNTLYDIASLTKTFTATLCYIAVEEKKLDINKSIFDIDNRFVNLTEVTPLDLLAHKVELWTNGYLGDSKNKEEFLNKLYTVTIKSKNPTYVDVHYMILSRILEIVYNEDYYELLLQKIIRPLGLENTTFYPKRDIASCNFEHTPDGDVTYILEGCIHDTKARVAKEFGIHTGHAGLFTTAEDFMKFLISFVEEDKMLLKPETIKFMLDHRNIDKENLVNMSKFVSVNEDVNLMYKECFDKKLDVHVSRCINNMGVRYKQRIALKNDVPYIASDNSIAFSGYSGPMFMIDFDRKIIIVIMCNVVHNSHLNRVERKALTDELIEKIYEKIEK